MTAGPCPLAPQSQDLWLNGADPVAFVHVMKTGGTSYHSFLAEVVQTNGRPIPATWQAVLDEKARTAPGGPLRAISGHFLICDVLQHFPRARIATILRDPVARLLSLHRYLASMPDHTRARMTAEAAAAAARAAGMEAADWIAANAGQVLAQVNNVYAYSLGGSHADLIAQRDLDAMTECALANLDAAAFVGVTEEMRDCVLLTALDNGLNRRITEPVKNVTPGGAGRTDADSAARLAHLVGADRLLHARARTLFHRRLRARIGAALAAAGLDGAGVVTAGPGGDRIAAPDLAPDAALLRSLALHAETIAPGAQTAEAWIPLRAAPVRQVQLTLAPEAAAAWPAAVRITLDGRGLQQAGRSGAHGETVSFAPGPPDPDPDPGPDPGGGRRPGRLRLLADSPFGPRTGLQHVTILHG